MFNLRDSLKEINSLTTDEEIINFVKKRVSILESSTAPTTINNYDGTNKIYNGYINSNSPVITSNLVNPFCLNDVDLYINFIKVIKSKNITGVMSFINELQKYIIDTFDYKGDFNKRVSVYLSNKDQKNISIKEFYHNNSALCSERSASVQNLASLVGLNSYFIIGKLTSEDESETHCYNIFKMKNDALVLFDVTNPVILENGSYVPAINDLGVIDINDVKQVDFDFDYLSNLYKIPVHSEEANRLRTYFTSDTLKVVRN